MALCTICLCSRRTMGARQHPAETFSSCSPTSSRGLGCARGVTARPGGETAPTATEMVGSERHPCIYGGHSCERGEEGMGGRKWCPLPEPGYDTEPSCGLQLFCSYYTPGVRHGDRKVASWLH